VSGESIDGLDVYVVDVPLRMPVETAHGRFVSQRSVVVRVHLCSGVAGFGEVDPVPGFSDVPAHAIAEGIAAIAPSLCGVSIEEQRAWEKRIAALHYGRQAVETALLDAAARTRGVPLGALLGAVQRTEFALAGWIGWGSAEEAAAAAADWKKRGFGGLKLKIGSGIALDVDRVAAVRGAVGPGMHLIIDAGEAYDAAGAIALLRKVEPYDVAACEQPIPQDDLGGLARIRKETGMPLILDESVRSLADLDRAVAAEAVDIIKLKLVKHDGLRSAVAMGFAAAERGVRCTVGHGFALGLTTLAEGHIASVVPNFFPPGEMVGPLKMTRDVARPAPSLDSGRLVLPAVPGLGADADPEALRSLQPVRIA
jgi:L-alanine-DL-glutamate epimerase-like enolase superfamily enzyme